jgi:hypothetical protein
VVDNGEGRALRERPGPAPTTTAAMLPDQAHARRRVEAMERHRRICRELEQLASLVEYYCGSRRPAA